MRIKNIAIVFLLGVLLVPAFTLGVIGAEASPATVSVSGDSLTTQNTNYADEISRWANLGTVDAMVSAGFEHTVGLRSDGTVVTAGSNGWGQCEVASWSGIAQ